DLDRVARFLRLGFGQADAGDLRVAVGAAGNRIAVERVRVDLLVAELLRDRLDRGDALVARLVRQPRTRRTVTDRPDPLGLRAAIRIDLDEPAVHFDELLEPDVLGVGDDADGDDDVAVFARLDLAVLALDLRRDALVRDLEFLERGAGLDRHALFGQRLFEKRGDVGVFHRNDPVEHFHDRNFGAHVVVEACELDPDRARADHQQLARHLGRGHRVAIGPHALAVGRGERQIPRPRAGGDDHVLRRERLGALFAFHLERVGALEYAGAHVHGDLVLLHQVRDALVELFRHPARTLHHRLKIGLYPLGDEAIILGVPHVV